MHDPRETHLTNLRQLSFGGDTAEAYWSHDGTQLMFQTTRPPYQCDQIMTQTVDDGSAPRLMSTGKGRTTCSYYLKGDKEIIYSSTHAVSPECPPVPDHSQGYVWSLYDFGIYRANADGSNPHVISDSPGHYDAESTVCNKDGSIIFTSDRDGDLDLYRMDADGSNVKRITNTVGYDGGAFFNSDCSQIVWRASRPTGAALDDYKKLLAQHLVRPTQLEIYVANADGSNAHQVTYLNAASFAPFFHPSGKRILFASNYGDPKGREFDIWAINTDGTNLERITYASGFDGFPMFSPDGKRLAFSSNRRDTVMKDGKPVYRVTGGAVGEHDTNLYVADWIENPPTPSAPQPETAAADRFLANVAYLADDAREGRGIGTKGLTDSLQFLATQLTALGVAPAAADGTMMQPFDVVESIQRDPSTSLTVDGKIWPGQGVGFMPTSFSNGKPVSAQVVFVGWGITTPKDNVSSSDARDDYRGVDVKGKIVLVHRFVPANWASKNEELRRRAGDLEWKAFVAREHGAVGMIVVDDGDLKAAESPLPELSRRTTADAGIAVVVGTRDLGAQLRKPAHHGPGRGPTVAIHTVLVPKLAKTANVVGVIRAPHSELAPIVVGAHVDHLGMGGESALDTAPAIHNGADDNASGVAALIEVARTAVAHQSELKRDIYIVGFSGEEMGILGSAYVVAHAPWAKTPMAMLNMDMVGRMRANQLTVLGADSAPEWRSLVTTACAEGRVECSASGSGYGPSDHMSFSLAGVPVLHFFTGSHLDYHRATDDTQFINAGGGAQVAQIVANIALALAKPDATLTYVKVAEPQTGGDLRMGGASLGTVPSYDDDPGQPPGVRLSDVVPGGAAATAGLKAGDRIVQIGASNVRNVEDLMFVLSSAKPGEKTKITFVRDGKTETLPATFGKPRARH